MPDLRIHDVTPDSLPLLCAALEQLSADLGDTHRADSRAMSAALFSPFPACRGVLATGADGALFGAALFSPVMSTTRGAPGAYVSDLWVAPAARGQALGRGLLAHVAARAEQLWQACYIRLISYDDNPRALRFYTRLGFETPAGETALLLGPAGFAKLKE